MAKDSSLTVGKAAPQMLFDGLLYVTPLEIADLENKIEQKREPPKDKNKKKIATALMM